MTRLFLAILATLCIGFVMPKMALAQASTLSRAVVTTDNTQVGFNFRTRKGCASIHAMPNGVFLHGIASSSAQDLSVTHA